jgi:Aspartyl protease
VRRLVTTSRPSARLPIRAIRIRSVPNTDTDLKSIRVDTKILDGKKIVETRALIDSGAQGTFMDERFAKKHGFPLVKLEKEIPVSNVDDTPNQNGPIKSYTRLPMRINGKEVST